MCCYASALRFHLSTAHLNQNLGRIGAPGYGFFQAEDGIRDKLVTGVQTCALPISPDAGAPERCTAGRNPDIGSGRSKIGRASCRERGEISVVAVSLKKNDDTG